TTFGTATQLVFTTQPVAGASGAAFTTQPVVKVEESGGNVVTSSAQTMSLTPSGGALSSCSGLTAVSGVYTVANCTFAGTVGTNYTLTAQTTSGVSVSGVSATFSPSTFGTATQLVYTAQPAAGASGAAFTTQPVIAIEDSAGNVVTSSGQTITLNASGGTLSNCSGLTASSGIISVSGCTFAGKVGTNYTLTATTTSAPVVTGTSNSFSPTTFGTATQLVFTTPPVAGASGTAFTTQPVVKVEDSGGNVVTSSAQTMSLTPSGGSLSNCSGLTASSGVFTVANCTFAGLVGTNYTLTAQTTSGVSVSGISANFSPTTFGTATQLVFATQPIAGASGAAFTTQPVVKVEDSGGNVVTSSSQTITLVASGGTLSNCSGLTAASGVVTVTGCKFAGTVGTNYTLTATTTSAPVVTGTSAGFSPSTFGTATQLVFTTQPVAGASGAAFATQPVIAVEDSAGNVVTSSSQTITLVASGGTLSSCSGLTAVSGVFTVTGCTFAGTVGTNYTLTATTTAAPIVTGTSANFSPSTFGTATQIVLSGSTADLPIGSTRQLTATVEDSAGNIVTSGADSTASITFARTAGTGSVIGLGSSAAISGVASDTVTGATAGSVTLRASGTINGSATNSNTLTFSVDAVNSVDLYTEVHAYNGTHTTNNSSNVATDFSFYSGAKNDQGGSVTWTNAALTDGSMTYTASSASNGKWSNGNAGPIGPFTTSPFNGVSVTPGPTNSGGQQGFAAVTKLTVPAAPSGSYQAGATIQVQATWTSGTGSSVWVYLLDSTGAVVAGSTNPVQVQSGSSMNTTFSIATPSTGTVYYVAVAPTSSTTTTATLDVTAALPYR
ncbi:MAG TPA: hypothetical protein VFC09_15025, partial [Candidatus Dormibacteraeota bacterium]|nr:hypothetical protein [Candidatus Dormibacteraeota bacterium]